MPSDAAQRLVDQAQQLAAMAGRERELRELPAWLVPGPGRCAPALGLHERCEHDRPAPPAAHHNTHFDVPGCTV